MEKAIKENLPSLLDQTIFKNRSFSEIVSSHKANLNNLQPTSKSYGSFTTNTESVLGNDSMLQRCHSLLTGAHNIDISKIDIAIKSKFHEGTTKYESDNLILGS